MRQAGATCTTVSRTTAARERRKTITVERFRARPLRAIQPRLARARVTRAGRLAPRAGRLAPRAEEAALWLLVVPADVGPRAAVGCAGEPDAPFDLVPEPVSPSAVGGAGLGTGCVAAAGCGGCAGTVGVGRLTVGSVGSVIVGVGGRSMPGASAAKKPSAPAAASAIKSAFGPPRIS